jgi:DNA-binding NarL/FixJ family response regulator
MIRVLIVSGDGETRDACRRILQNSGYDVRSASSRREELLALMHRERFDVVVSDLDLPDMAGPELVDLVQQTQTQSAVVLIGLRGLEASVQRLPGCEYVQRPVNALELVRAVERSLVARHQPRDAGERPDYPSGCSRPRLLLMVGNRLVRDSLKCALAAEAKVDIVGATEPAHQVASLVRKLGAQVVVMDSSPRQRETVHAVRDLAGSCPETKVVVLDVMEVESDFVALIEAGASGLLLKNAAAEEVVRTVQVVLSGEKALPRALTSPLFSLMVARAVDAKNAEWNESERITKREREIIALMAEGLSNKEIASRLNIATFTVKTHVHNILEKLALETRLQVVRRYSRSKINGSDYLGSGVQQ